MNRIVLLTLALGGCLAQRQAEVVPAAVAAADSLVRQAMAAEQSLDPARVGTRAVAVAPFQVSTRDPSLAVLSFGLADLLMTDLARSSQLQVVDRLRIDAYLREAGLAATGRVDSATAPRFGRIVGAGRIVLGTLEASRSAASSLGGRLGDVVTGAVTPIASLPPGSLDAILEAQKALAFAVFDQLGIELTPAERALVEQRHTKRLAALLAYSRGVRAELRLELQQARADYQEALRLDAGFSAAATRIAELNQWGVLPAARSEITDPLLRVGLLAAEGVIRGGASTSLGAADPAFRQRQSGTLIIILNLP